MKIFVWGRGLALVLSLAMGVTSATSASAAVMLTTEVALAGEQQTVRQFLERQEIQRTLHGWGVDPAEAQRRVAAMTPDELRDVSKRIQELPAGQDAIVIGTGTLLLILILYLIFR